MGISYYSTKTIDLEAMKPTRHERVTFWLQELLLATALICSIILIFHFTH